MLCSGLDNFYVESLYTEKDYIHLHTTYKATTASYLGGRQIKEVLNITFGTIADNDVSFALKRNPRGNLQQAPKNGHNHAMRLLLH